MPITSSSSSPVPRTPNFLEEVRGTVARATFGGTLQANVQPFFERRGGMMTPAETPSIDPPPGMEPLAPPLPPPIPQPGPEFAQRLAKAIADLRRSGERLAEQATADALEMGVLIARRILEAELSTGPAALTGLVRSAIGRLGESRKIQVRLCPADAEAVQAADAADEALAGMTLARVEIRADATLSPGDCIVDGEHGTVDGRLSTRLDEVRRILTRALGEGEGGRAMTADTETGEEGEGILAEGEGQASPSDTAIDEALDAISAEFELLGDSPSMGQALQARAEVSVPVPMPAQAPGPVAVRPAPETLAARTVAPNRQLMARVQKALNESDPVVVSGKVTRASGIIVEATLPQVAVGTACVIEVGEGRLISAEVVGFARSKALLMPFGELAGIGEGCPVWPRASAAEIPVGESLLGRVVDAGMRPVDGLGAPSLGKTAALNAAPPPAMQRRRIGRPLVLGIRSLDACLTCGEGQRVGIMAGPGVGKSVLLGMLARSASADIIVCGLVGERGREVREFVERDLGPAGLARSVVVVATADEPPLVRVRAAMAATAIAEFFRARGKKVLLLVDSLSRVAMAQREIGLAAGEPPTSRGYPPSVFAALPRLVERAGNDAGEGSITAMYTVLAEGDDLSDPVADAARAALDGHVVLSRKLANAGHFPAVDVLASVSRVMSDVVTPDHRRLAMEAREVLSTYRDSADLIEVGAYVAGSNPRVDRALRSIHAVNALFRQEPSQRFTLENTLLGLRRALEAPAQEAAARG